MEGGKWNLSAGHLLQLVSSLKRSSMTQRRNMRNCLRVEICCISKFQWWKWMVLKLVQSKAILSYIAGKYNLYGKDLKERLFIDMYTEGIHRPHGD
ncbi:unnamed protein product [Staurois parvus]|uniref:Uncharacterized protein n=1 Tax=Staurois parvus TaxID=386267 RepID=A0ABN9HB16_9NEOB|nr:unnamed protein product [Staurois parvus]